MVKALKLGSVQKEDICRTLFFRTFSRIYCLTQLLQILCQKIHVRQYVPISGNVYYNQCIPKTLKKQSPTGIAYPHRRGILGVQLPTIFTETLYFQIYYQFFILLLAELKVHWTKHTVYMGHHSYLKYFNSGSLRFIYLFVWKDTCR